MRTYPDFEQQHIVEGGPIAGHSDGGVSIHTDFQSSKIRPILFSHSNMDSPTMYLGLLSDLASRGYMVFAPYHEDGTCSYT